MHDPNIPTYSSSFFNNKSLSDVTIKFGSESVSAHKVMLSQRSSYFKNMFCGSFKACLCLLFPEQIC